MLNQKVKWVNPLRRLKLFATSLLLLAVVCACESTYYDAMEKVGVHKREILVDRIVDTQEVTKDAQQQFKSALEQFKDVVDFDGGDLEGLYNKLNDEYLDSETAVEKNPTAH